MKNRGFTLIELLIAVSLIAVFAMFIFGGVKATDTFGFDKARQAYNLNVACKAECLGKGFPNHETADMRCFCINAEKSVEVDVGISQEDTY